MPLETASDREICRELVSCRALYGTTPGERGELGGPEKQRPFWKGQVRQGINLQCSDTRGSGDPWSRDGLSQMLQLEARKLHFHLYGCWIGTVSAERGNLGWGLRWIENFQAGIECEGSLPQPTVLERTSGNEPWSWKTGEGIPEQYPAPTFMCHYKISSSPASILLMPWSCCPLAFEIFV